MRYILIICFFTVSLLADTLQKVSLQLSWFNQFQFAGYYIAKEKGFYESVGLDVEIKPFNFDVNVVEDVNTGKVDFGVGRETLILESIDRNLVFLNAIFQSSPLVLLTTKDSQINSVKEFQNRKLMATRDDAAEISLRAMIRSQGISLDTISYLPHTHNINDLIDKKTDIISAYISKGPHELQVRGVQYNIFHPKDYGFDMYSDFLFTSKRVIHTKPSLAENFNKATLEGWKYAYENIEETVDLIREKYNTQNLSREALIYEAKELKKLSYFKTNKLGDINKAKVQRIYDLYNVMGFVKKPIDVDSLIFQSSYDIFLTKEEMAWVDKNSIITYSFVPFPPLGIDTAGVSSGMMQDILNLISEKTGLTFVYIASKNKSDLQEKFLKKEVNIIPGIKIEDTINFKGVKSNIHDKYPMVVVTKNKQKYAFIDNLFEFGGEKVSIFENDAGLSFLQNKYPGVIFQVVGSIEDAILQVENGEVEAFVGHVASSLYYLSANELKNLKVSGVLDFEYEHRFLINQDKKILLSIINKAMRAIGHVQEDAIYQKWINYKPLEEKNSSIIIFSIVVSIVIVLYILYRYTKLIKLTKKVQDDASRLNLSIMGNQEGIFDWNIEENSIYFSPRWKEILGYQDSELENIFDTWRERVHPDDYPTVMSAVQEYFEGLRENFDNLHRMQHKKGHWVWIYARGICQKDEDGKVIRMIGTHLDITENKQMQLKIQQQTQIIQEVHDSIISTDTKGYITSWNQGSVNMFGCSSIEALGKHIRMIYPKEVHQKVDENIDQLLISHHLSYEERLITKSSSTIYADISLSTFRDTKGNVTGLIGYAKDITDRKNAEKDLLEQKEILDYQAHHDGLTGLPNRVFT